MAGLSARDAEAAHPVAQRVAADAEQRAARTTLPPARASAARMRAASSSVRRPRRRAAGAGASVGDGAGGPTPRALQRRRGSTSSSGLSSVTRSIRWPSSRTLPGHAIGAEPGAAHPSVSRLGGRPCAVAYGRGSARRGAAMSSPRSRSGGMRQDQDGEPVVEVGAEAAAVDQRRQVALRRGDQLDVDSRGATAPRRRTRFSSIAFSTLLCTGATANRPRRGTACRPRPPRTGPAWCAWRR